MSPAHMSVLAMLQSSAMVAEKAARSKTNTSILSLYTREQPKVMKYLEFKSCLIKDLITLGETAVGDLFLENSRKNEQ